MNMDIRIWMDGYGRMDGWMTMDMDEYGCMDDYGYGSMDEHGWMDRWCVYCAVCVPVYAGACVCVCALRIDTHDKSLS